MAYVMFQYDRPTDTHRWNDYNQQVRDWIAQLLQIPGAVSFVAYRTSDGTSPDTITMLDSPDCGGHVQGASIRAVAEGSGWVAISRRDCPGSPGGAFTIYT